MNSFFQKLNQILKKIFFPGIRLKLAAFTALLIFLLVSVVGFFHLRQQERNARKQITREVQPVFDTLGNMLIQQLTLNDAIDKLYPFRTKIISKKKKSRSSSYALDKYFDEKHLKPLEKEIRSQLRDDDGNLLTDKEASAFINRRVRTTYTRSYKRETNKWAPTSLFGVIKKEKTVTRRYSQTKLVENRQKKERAKQQTLSQASRDMLSLLNLDTSRYRVQTFNTKNELLFDSRSLQSGNYSPVHALDLKKQEFWVPLKEHWDEIAEVDKNLGKKEWYELPLSSFLDTDLKLPENKRFFPVIHHVFLNPESSERARLILQNLKELREHQPSVYSDFTATEKAYTEKLKAKQQEIRDYTRELRERKLRAMPGRDERYRKLYREYNDLRKEYLKALSVFFPQSSTFAKDLKRNEKKIQGVKEKVKKEKADLAELKKTLNDKDKKIIQRTEKISSLQEELEILQADREQLQYQSENWSFNKNAFLADSAILFRDSLLYDAASLSGRHFPELYQNYLASDENRSKLNSTRDNLRFWIERAASETGDLVYLVNNRGRVTTARRKILEHGILAASRSELEEKMWKIDTTPLDKLATENLLEENNAGYLRLIIDLQNYQEQMKQIRNRNNLILSVSGILGTLLAWLLAGLMVRRLRQIIFSAEKAAVENKLDVHFPEKGNDEIATLGQSLNFMMDGLQKGEEMRSQVSAAASVQQKLLPASLPSLYEKNVYLSGFYKPMSGIGGDYYDVIEISKDEFAICIGDVSNHGIGPSLVMSNFSAQLKLLINMGERDIRKILSVLNERLFLTTPDTMFITFFLAIYNIKDKTLDYGIAGHTDTLIYRSDKKQFTMLPGNGIPIGMDENDFFLEVLSTGSVKLQSGDTVLLYTDGVSEAMNDAKELFGEDRLKKAFKQYITQSPPAIIENIVREVENFSGRRVLDENESQLNDDIAMLVCKII